MCLLPLGIPRNGFVSVEFVPSLTGEIFTPILRSFPLEPFHPGPQDCHISLSHPAGFWMLLSGNYPRKIPWEIHISSRQTGKKKTVLNPLQRLWMGTGKGCGRKQFLVSHPPRGPGHGQATHREIFPQSSPWIIYEGLKMLNPNVPTALSCAEVGRVMGH